MKHYAVILGGGNGKRLWPLSRISRPKQFLNLLGKGPLIADTISRLEQHFEKGNVFIVGLAEHKEALLESTKGLVDPENIFYEPVGRGTSAGIAWAAMNLAEAGTEDAVMCVFPSDHYIKDLDVFWDVIGNACNMAAQKDSIVTVGIQPTFDATGYGYIKVGSPVPGFEGAYEVVSFIEKPNKQRANAFFKSGEYLWNGGIFIAKVSVMLAKIKEFLPELYEEVAAAHKAEREGDLDAAVKIYEQVDNVAIDIGVMEKCKDSIVLPGFFGWSDIGSFYAVHDILKDERGNAVMSGSLIAPEASNLTVYSDKRIVAASGVDNLVIIDMDDVLYICNVKDSEKTKNLVENLVNEGHAELE